METADHSIQPMSKSKDEIELPKYEVQEFSNIEFDEDTIKKLIRKMDYRLIPYLTLLYLFSFLDRVNIGFARLYRMEDELHLSPDQYSWTLSIFFVGYVLFEVPSNLLLKKVTPPRWIARIMVTWGAITMALAAVKNFEGLMAGRFFLGVSEAGLFPGIIYFLSFWYTRKELGLRIALLFSASSLAGAFSGLLAYGISFIDQHRGLSGWQWIFIIEGLPSVLIGIATWWLLPSTPGDVKWLSQPERDFLVQRLLKDHTDSSTKTFRKEQLKEAFIDYKVYMYMLINFGLACPIFALAQLLPTIINGMGFSKLTSLLLAAPPHAVGVITTIAVAYNSDKKMERCFHYCLPLTVSVIGFLIMAVARELNVKYFGSFLVVIGGAASLPILLSWLNSNMLGSTKAGTAFAIVISFGNVGGIVAGQLYRRYEAPNYLPSILTCLAFMIMSLVLALILRYRLSKENAKLDIMANEEDFRWEERQDGLDVRNFRYTL